MLGTVVTIDQVEEFFRIVREKLDSGEHNENGWLGLMAHEYVDKNIVSFDDGNGNEHPDFFCAHQILIRYVRGANDGIAYALTKCSE